MPVKIHFKLLVFVLVVAIAGFAAHDVARGGRSPAALPEIHFYDKSDARVTLDDFRGEAVLVNIWATWCTPCVAEMPSLDRLQAKYPKDKFRVVAISVDNTSMAAVEKFLAAHGVKNLDPYWDQDRQVPLKWKYDGIPTSFLLDRQGGVVKKYNGGYAWDDAALDEEIGALLH